MRKHKQIEWMCSACKNKAKYYNAHTHIMAWVVSCRHRTWWTLVDQRFPPWKQGRRPPFQQHQWAFDQEKGRPYSEDSVGREFSGFACSHSCWTQGEPRPAKHVERPWLLGCSWTVQLGPVTDDIGTNSRLAKIRFLQRTNLANFVVFSRWGCSRMTLPNKKCRMFWKQGGGGMFLQFNLGLSMIIGDKLHRDDQHH